MQNYPSKDSIAIPMSFLPWFLDIMPTDQSLPLVPELKVLAS